MGSLQKIFPLCSGRIGPGDLVFFHRIPQRSNSFDEAVVSSSLFNSNVYHVALALEGEKIVHATDQGVHIESLATAISNLLPDAIELTTLNLDPEWKFRASLWAEQQVPAEYNDLFSPECINSHNRKAFYCCQLACEAYKATHLPNPSHPDPNPFLPHKLNFHDSQGRMIPYWIEYYKQLSPTCPDPPQGAPGSHPSILRRSPVVELVAARALFFSDQGSSTGSMSAFMKKFQIPQDLLNALHFVNGARVNLKSPRKFTVVEPRNGIWEVRDNGKSITEAKADVLSCADTFEYFSGVDLVGEHIPYDDATKRFAYTRREPFGVVGAIGAWNYPIQTATWKIAPAIACGNSGEGETGSALCESKNVRKVSFTGSVSTGKAIARACVNTLIKPVTLELGGKSSCIMLHDCDVDMAINGALMANFYSQGQVCSNASKILVDRRILDEFTSKLMVKTKNMRIGMHIFCSMYIHILLLGDPLNEETHVGACITLAHLQKVQTHIQGAIKEGAKLLYGGERVIVDALEKGYFLSPCVLSNITPQMKIYGEEEALRIANDTEFGLAAGVFTNNLNKAHNLASRLEAGTVYINTFNDTSPLIPFGGYKQSGYGRENGKSAMEHYTQIKSVFVNVSKELDNPFP
ncbi:aldehyde dehydrogenase family domain-containing protein [Ditylenchus destructor]|nr:aldehyde dehydrogenase family domain-containing protein [Ditylenchus destructor]